MNNEQLFYRYKQGDVSAREQLIIQNQKLVWYVARKYMIMFDTKMYDIEDLFQIGIIGLMRAIEKYNPSLSCKFSTYAVYWIKQTIRRALEKEEDTLSLDENIGDDESNLTLLDMLEDKNIRFVEEVEIKELKKVWDIIQPHLTKEELKYLKIKCNTQLEEAKIFECLGIDEREGRRLRDRAIRKARSQGNRIKQQFEEYLDERTTFISAIDYSKPNIKTMYKTSVVESIVLQRENLREARG